jgi:hypothetical protein
MSQTIVQTRALGAEIIGIDLRTIGERQFGALCSGATPSIPQAASCIEPGLGATSGRPDA